MAILQQKVFRNISIGELLGCMLFVLFWGAFNLFDAGTRIILSIPVWWLFFVTLAQTPLKHKALLHLISLPAFCYAYLLVKRSIPGFSDNQPSFIRETYSTILFYCSGFAILHMYSYWQRSNHRHIREQELMELNYQTEIKALKARIEPHFLFNTLNSISASVPPALEETRVLIAQLADTFRYALKVSERPLVNLEEEIDFVRTWLALEKQRFGKRLELIYDIDASTFNTPVPPMILQPLLENALAHGIGPMVNGGAITVSCKQEPKHVRISITDTGAGFDAPLETIFSRGHGLNNTSGRLEKFFGEPLIICRNPHGMCFSFRIPVSFIPSSRQMSQRSGAERSAW